MIIPPIPTEAVSLISKQASGPVPVHIHILAQKLRERYGNSVLGILFYGSCLRDPDNLEGIADLYLIVDSYYHTYDNPCLAGFNKLLPPNVFYMEVPWRNTTLRCKYGIFSLDDIHAGTSAWFHSYLWGRLSQIVRLVYTKNNEIKDEICKSLASAVFTFISCVVPVMRGRFTCRELWQKGLSFSYNAELRPERQDRAVGLFDYGSDYYEKITHIILTMPLFSTKVMTRSHGLVYEVRIPILKYFYSRFLWNIRFFQGKVLSLLRLLKGFFTFENGIEYIIWKIERHSGIRVTVSPRLRRIPVVGAIAIFWRLYRSGAFN